MTSNLDVRSTLFDVKSHMSRNEMMPHRAEPVARRFLRVGLGGLWVLDGALQAQPRMPTHFISDVIEPALVGQPSWLVSAANPLVRLWIGHPVLSDQISIWLQIGIGLAILQGKSRFWFRAGVIASILWGFGIWIVGEAFGGLLVPGASLISGTPGAALVYVFGSALLLAPMHFWLATNPRFPFTSHGGRLASQVLDLIFIGGAALQVAPWEGGWGLGLAKIFERGGIAIHLPALFAPATWLGRVAAAHPIFVNSVVILLFTSLGMKLLLARLNDLLILVAARPSRRIPEFIIMNNAENTSA
jgi:hypothetical protein